MGMSAGAGGGAMSEINVTPLVDVMLVLLIIFMVATPLIEREHAERELLENRDKQQRLVTLNLPVLDKSPPKVTNDTTTTVLSVDSKLAVTLGGAPVVTCSEGVGAVDKSLWVPCFDKIQAALTGHERVQSFGVSVDAAPAVPFGFVVGVMHRIRKAGVEKLSMMP